MIDVSDPKSYTTCSICNQKMRRITWKHMEKHNITVSEYLKSYPKASIDCEYIREYQSDRLSKLSKSWHEDPIRESKRLNSMRVTVSTKEYSDRRSKIAKRLWDDENFKSKRLDLLLSKGMKLYVPLSREAEILRQKNIKQRRHEKGLQLAKCTWSRSDFRSMVSNLASSMNKDPNNSFGKRKGVRVWYKGICYKSSWEYEFAKFLDSIDLHYRYEPFTAKTDVGNYTPDFYIKELHLLIEVKPYYFINEIVTKKFQYLEFLGYEILCIHEYNWKSILDSLVFRKNNHSQGYLIGA